jgi:hypothetical protein
MKTTYTAEKIAETTPYKEILEILKQAERTNRKISFIHLRYALCKEHGIPLKKRNGKPTRQARFLKEFEKEFHCQLVIITEKIKGDSRHATNNLNQYLRHLRRPEIDLITEGPYYQRTKKARMLSARSLLKNDIDHCPDDKLLKLEIHIQDFMIPIYEKMEEDRVRFTKILKK